MKKYHIFLFVFFVIVSAAHTFISLAAASMNPHAIQFEDDYISAGALHTCAIIQNNIYCWGDNEFGQLGNGTNTNSLVPVRVDGLDSEPIAVVAGTTHTCAIVSRNRELWCWGRNDQGQLGNRTRIDQNIPVRVEGLMSVRRVTLGASHTCAKISDHRVDCWGANQDGQLGTGDRGSRTIPTMVQGLINNSSANQVIDIAAHSNKTCALIGNAGGSQSDEKTSEIRCWGLNYGELGNAWVGTQFLPRTVKVFYSPPLSPNANQADLEGIGKRGNFLSLGDSHFCLSPGSFIRMSIGLATLGKSYCLGSNSSGQLGIDGLEIRENAINEFPLGIQKLFVGNSFSCARTKDQKAYCWGDYEDGRLGGAFNENQYLPRLVRIPGSIQGLSAGHSHACALSNGGVYCWGLNIQGQLGDNSTENRSEPVRVHSLHPRIGGLAAGKNHTCAIFDESVKCFGRNDEGQLGNNSRLDSNRPVQVQGLENEIKAIVSGENFSCALQSGAVKCWGENTFGQLGRGSAASSSVPEKVIGLSGVTLIAAGKSHACAIAQDTLYCWGANFNGQLGPETQLAISTTPVRVEQAIDQINIDTLALGNTYTCVKHSYDMKVTCFGHDILASNQNITSKVEKYNQERSTKRELSVPLLLNNCSFDSMCAANSHLCFICKNGGRFPDNKKTRYYSLGQSSYTEELNYYLGNQNKLSELGFPESDSLLADTKAISMNALNHLCMIYQNQAYCVGKNLFGELGDGTQSAKNTLSPVLGLGKNLRNIEVGSHHTCVVDNWDLKCWGRNTFGQLGNGTNLGSREPVSIHF